MRCQTEDCVYSKSCMGDSNLYLLSYHDEPIAVKDYLVDIENYRRTAKWKCPNGHISLDECVISADLLKPDPPIAVDGSAKRFHRKGFRGHIVKPPHAGLKLPKYPPSQTNHQRHRANRLTPLTN